MPQTPRRTPVSTSTSSIEPCDDLMEIDYSANRLRQRLTHSRIKHQSAGVVHTSAEKLTVPRDSSATVQSYVGDGYMDMSPKSAITTKTEMANDMRVSSDGNLSPPRLNRHHLVVGRSAPVNVCFSKQQFTKNSPSSSASAGLLEKVIETEPYNNCKRSVDDDSSYMDMKPGVCNVQNSLHKITPVLATATNLHARKESFTILDPANLRSQVTCTTLPHIKQRLLDTDGKQFKTSFAEMKHEKYSNNSSSLTPDGYVDMTFKDRRPESQQPTKPVIKIAEKTPDGYVDMSFKKNSRKNLVDSNSTGNKPESKMQQCCSGKENQQDARQSSKPIAIQQSKNKRSNGSGFFRRYKSDETQTSKPNFLPLSISTFASLGRKKKVCQKKDKTEAMIGHNGTIFPLSPDRTPSLNYDPNSKCAITASGESVPLTPEFEIRSVDRMNEIISWDRRKGGSVSGDVSVEDNSCDYIIMTPGVVPGLQRKISEPACPSYSITAVKNGNEETAKDSIKILHRSTSEPCTMSSLRTWRRCPSSPEFGKVSNNDDKCRSEIAAVNNSSQGQTMDVDRDTVPCEASLNQDNVPNTCASTSVSSKR